MLLLLLLLQLPLLLVMIKAPNEKICLLVTMEHDGSSSSSVDDFGDSSDCEFAAMQLPHIPGAATDVVAAAAAAGLFDTMQCSGTSGGDSVQAAEASAGVDGALYVEERSRMDNSGEESDSGGGGSSSSSSTTSSSSSSSSECDAIENREAVAAMLEVDSDDEVLAEPVVAAAQVLQSTSHCCVPFVTCPAGQNKARTRTSRSQATAHRPRLRACRVRRCLLRYWGIGNGQRCRTCAACRRGALYIMCDCLFPFAADLLHMGASTNVCHTCIAGHCHMSLR